ncbi:hypothetical protein SLEP1_g35534 [Rubroshorea leprosula]|uniref:Fatty acid desaturase domain-containing protein n=1 Tax=Rubroshorea leprosula TaxID=152421 RepID=A0AAV5KNR3_9ROSI|nr:hypothetical protein SLEP1_g35534 [Rubroshorea leprosula]
MSAADIELQQHGSMLLKVVPMLLKVLQQHGISNIAYIAVNIHRNPVRVGVNFLILFSNISHVAEDRVSATWLMLLKIERNMAGNRRISHRTHHQNHGNVEKDESWVPLPEKIYKNLETSTRILRFTLPFPLFAYPIYLWYRTPGKEGSHFNPYSDLFTPNERKFVMTSIACWMVVASILVYLCFPIGSLHMLKLYGVPYLIFIVWLDGVTYLHHHGYKRKLPWYRGKVT